MCLYHVGADGEQLINTFCHVFFSQIVKCSMTCWAFAGEGLQLSSGFVLTGAGFIGFCGISAELNSWRVLLRPPANERILAQSFLYYYTIENVQFPNACSVCLPH